MSHIWVDPVILVPLSGFYLGSHFVLSVQIILASEPDKPAEN